MLPQKGIQITATCVVAGLLQEAMCNNFFDYVSFMSRSKCQEHYFGGLVIGQSSKIIWFTFLRAFFFFEVVQIVGLLKWSQNIGINFPGTTEGQEA